jgi:hypothetical protein
MIKKWYIDLIKNKKRILVAIRGGIAKYNCELVNVFLSFNFPPSQATARQALRTKHYTSTSPFDPSATLRTIRV